MKVFDGLALDPDDLHERTQEPRHVICARDHHAHVPLGGDTGKCIECARPPPVRGHRSNEPGIERGGNAETGLEADLERTDLPGAPDLDLTGWKLPASGARANAVPPQPRRIKFSHAARPVFGRLDDRAAYEVLVFLEDLAASGADASSRDGWSILPSGIRVAYQVTTHLVLVRSIAP